MITQGPSTVVLPVVLEVVFLVTPELFSWSFTLSTNLNFLYNFLAHGLSVPA